jgi:lipid II:glycine glycyltransferase (peptidoglycan interpeptide bridge formation enzyme)
MSSVQLTAFAEGQDSWHRLLSRCARANLMQAWEYGEAKRVEGWQPVRLTVSVSGSPVGVVQALTRRFPVVGSLVRINRGPLFMDDETGRPDRLFYETLGALRNKLVDEESRVLLIAPEAGKDTEESAGLESIGFVRTSRPPWASGIVSLDADEDALRRSLDRKWRNQLKGSERAGVVVDANVSSAAFDSFMLDHQRFRRAKGFEGVSDALLAALREHIGAHSLCCVLKARLGGATVAGVVTVASGRTATLLLSWNSPEGRQVCAGHALLWFAMLTLKAAGYQWFDLGGIAGRTPTIDHFKRGLRPTEYELVGELIAVPRGAIGWAAGRLLELVA